MSSMTPNIFGTASFGGIVEIVNWELNRPSLVNEQPFELVRHRLSLLNVHCAAIYIMKIWFLVSNY